MAKAFHSVKLTQAQINIIALLVHSSQSEEMLEEHFHPDNYDFDGDDFDDPEAFKKAEDKWVLIRNALLGLKEKFPDWGYLLRQ